MMIHVKVKRPLVSLGSRVSVQEWKGGSPIFKCFRQYDPNFEQNTGLKLEDYPLKFCQVTHDPSKKGIHQYVFSLPVSVRSLYSRDSVRAEEWQKLITDFDQKFHYFLDSVILFSFTPPNLLCSYQQVNQVIALGSSPACPQVPHHQNPGGHRGS